VQGIFCPYITIFNTFELLRGYGSMRKYQSFFDLSKTVWMVAKESIQEKPGWCLDPYGKITNYL